MPDTPTDERRVSVPSLHSVLPECESESEHRPSTPRSIEAATEANRLRVVSTPVAIALLLGFVLFLTTPLATRAGLQNAGRTVPRALDPERSSSAEDQSSSPSSATTSS
ncbi:hypothetical protein CspHIS471_0303050 [Cutaneotrichosporon sp. HIS471]|nr:hypothetical protein CspHIS471_0303050 [Cutaneotrichosporon sp. HIS471]